MPERRGHDREFREGAVRIVSETSKSIAVVARERGSTRAPSEVGLLTTARRVRVPRAVEGDARTEGW